LVGHQPGAADQHLAAVHHAAGTQAGQALEPFRLGQRPGR
jgi:hypothetical protein